VVKAVLLLCIFCAICGSSSHAYTGRRAVLYTNVQVMLAENPPYVWGKADCSMQMWKLLKDLWPELTLTKWFHRTTAEAMAGWPWPPLMRLDEAMFGDLLFANSEDYPDAGVGATHASPTGRARRASPLQMRPAKADFFINHVLMQYVQKGRAVHAGKTKGFSETNLRPYWQPRIVLAIRPPY